MIGEACFVGIDQAFLDDIRAWIGEHVQEVWRFLFYLNNERIIIGCQQAVSYKRESWNKSCQQFV